MYLIGNIVMKTPPPADYYLQNIKKVKRTVVMRFTYSDMSVIQLFSVERQMKSPE